MPHMGGEAMNAGKSMDARDAAYARDYEKWVSSLSPEEKRQLAALKLDKPLLPDRASGCGLDEDVAESNAASYEPDMAQLVDKVTDESEGAAVRGEDVWDVVRRLVGELLVMPNRSLAVECLAVVSGLSYVGDSLSIIAQRHGVTRAAVSKRCVELTRKLHIMPSRAMRSLTARESYRKAQLRVRRSYE
jgi:hypothetical protein